MSRQAVGSCNLEAFLKVAWVHTCIAVMAQAGTLLSFTIFVLPHSSSPQSISRGHRAATFISS